MICASVLSAPVALASSAELQAVNRLLDQGKVTDAAKLVQSHLNQNPGDVQMRFLQGVVAAEQKKYDQAIKVFTALTEEYPSLPEPYNNLAVLYAAKGEERKAAQVLEQAIRTNPSYATAHENLGDLYARMASDAYAKALQLDSARQTVQPKLALIKQIFPVQAGQAAVQTPAASVATASTEPAKAVEAAKPVVQPAPAVAVQPEPTKQEVAKAEPAHTKANKPDHHKADEKQAQVKAVEAAVMAWAKAWSQQNMNAYYAAYSDKFEPQGSSLAAWKAERKERIVGKPEITVDVQDLKISLQGERAVANFRQYYAAGGYKATTRKVLRLNHEAGKWRIVREETGR